MTYDSTQDNFLRFPNSERQDFGSERSDLRSERPDLRSDRSDLRSERPDLRSGRADLGSKRSDLMSERQDLRSKGGGRTDGRTDGRKPEKIVLCGIIGHLPLGGRCPKGVSIERCCDRKVGVKGVMNRLNSKKMIGIS